ncbi:hypothetical protein HWV62_1302 [Athelia sp. TMB]|nr:hypothetical protein HWV62_1302 [Athelia sp. TMB]
MDIFTTEELSIANLIQYQFGQFGTKNESIYGSFDAAKLNESASIVNQSFTKHQPAAPGYIYATLTAFDATDPNGGGDGDGDGDGGSGSTTSSTKGTSVAMIILYAITGCVSALFVGVIVMGAVRALRHPDRYGPRGGRYHDGDSYNGGGQSRARGLTRAILDTFPIVKFNRSSADPNESPVIVPKDIESRPQSYGPDAEWDVMDVPLQMIERGDGKDDNHQGIPDDVEADVTEARPNDRPRASSSRMSRASYPPAGPSRPQSGGTAPPVPRLQIPNDLGGKVEDVVPAAIGTETCPICIVDFEEGDDLRLLPCEGKHRFHQECVDPWLLELSSSCPICRQDFQALETMMAGESEESYGTAPHSEYSPSPYTPHDNPQPQGRFSRYLRFARRRRNEIESAHGHGQEQHSQQERADPPLPASAENRVL